MSRRKSSRRPYQNGRDKGHGQFFALQHRFADTPQFKALSARAIRLFIALGLQYNGKNNGALRAGFRYLKQEGWFTSADQVQKAINELLETGWVVKTRQGGRNQPSLYAFTFYPIDECPTENLDMEPTKTAIRSWEQ